MENTNQNQYPSPARERRSNMLGLLLAVVSIILCCLLFCIGSIGLYYSAEIITGVNELVDIVARIDVVPEGNNPASPAEDETDIPNLPRGNESEFACGSKDEGIIYLIGGKPINGQGVEAIATMTLEYARGGAPLQPYFSQITDSDLENLTGISIKNSEEFVNDYAQFMVYCENGEWKAVKVARDSEDGVWFGDLSYIEANYDNGKLYWVLCNNDSGDPGTFTGTGTVCENYYSTTLAALYNDPDFDPYIGMFEYTRDYGSASNWPSNGKIEVFVIFFKPE